MVANPMTDEALEAFARRRLLSLSWWEKDLIFRLDDAAIGAWSGDRKREADERRKHAARGASPPGDSEIDYADKQIPVSDTKSLKAMLTGLAKRRRGVGLG